jgi:hypothetical protein
MVMSALFRRYGVEAPIPHHLPPNFIPGHFIPDRHRIESWTGPKEDVDAVFLPGIELDRPSRSQPLYGFLSAYSRLTKFSCVRARSLFGYCILNYQSYGRGDTTRIELSLECEMGEALSNNGGNETYTIISVGKTSRKK